MGNKKPFRVLSKSGNSVTWEADFWDGPTTPAETGRYIRHRFTDTLASAGTHVAASCSFYPQLMAAFR